MLSPARNRRRMLEQPATPRGAGRWAVTGRRKTVRRLGIAGFVALGMLPLAGCANLWDDVTSRDFKVRSLFSRDDPMTVLGTTTDGDERVKALRALKEPRLQGGGSADQDRAMEILMRCAIADPSPAVRIAAIEKLGAF